jgi:hypothetical protein
MNKREFNKLLKRDISCVATGYEGDRLIPNHRIGGMGGHRSDDPTNLVLMDSITNGLLESDADWRRKALHYGWRLESWEDPSAEPFFHVGLRRWVLPDSFWGLKYVPIPARIQANRL